MLSDIDLKRVTDDVVSIYQEIEIDMLNKLGQYLSVNDSIGGSAQWKIMKLEELSNFNADLVQILSKYTTKSTSQIQAMFEKAALANFNVGSGTQFTEQDLLANARVREQIKNFSTDLGRNLSIIRTNTINESKQEYLRIVDKATLETSSGIKSFTESISDSLKELGERGITGQNYQRSDGTIVRYNIEGLVRRDTLTGVFSIANQCFLDQAKELKVNYVYVSQHLGARTSATSKIANHAGWQGKIYMLEGHDDKYGNFYEETGAGTVEGFGGVNCRHRVSMAHEDMSVPSQYDLDENERMEGLFKYQRYLERALRSWKRKQALYKSSGNIKEYKKAKAKVNEWVDRLDQFTKKNNLRRDYSRERTI